MLDKLLACQKKNKNGYKIEHTFFFLVFSKECFTEYLKIEKISGKTLVTKCKNDIYGKCKKMETQKVWNHLKTF